MAAPHAAPCPGHAAQSDERIQSLGMPLSLRSASKPLWSAHLSEERLWPVLTKMTLAVAMCTQAALLYLEAHVSGVTWGRRPGVAGDSRREHQVALGVSWQCGSISLPPAKHGMCCCAHA